MVSAGSSRVSAEDSSKPEATAMSVSWTRTVPVVALLCLAGLFGLLHMRPSMLPMTDSVQGQEVAGAAALKEVSTLREAVFRGQDDVRKAVDMLKQELALLRQSRSGGDYPAAGTVTASPSTAPTGKIQSAAVADWLLAPAPAEAAPLQNPRAEVASPPSTVSGDQPKGPNGIRWDSSVLKRQESMAESQYWYQRREKNVRANAAFSHYMANWPCIWGEEYVGIGAGDGNKWMCGARLMQKPCVVYSFGSNRNIQFEKGIHNLGMNCEVHIYDPTSSAPHEAIQLGFKYHRIGLGGTDGWQNGLPVKTLATLMRENGHTHLDVLKVDIERAEHAAIKQIAGDGWPSVGQFLVEVHIDSDAPQASPLGNVGINGRSLDEFFGRIERANLRLFHQELNWEFGATCCSEYSFIHKDWLPETKMYDMQTAPTYRDVPLHEQRPRR